MAGAFTFTLVDEAVKLINSALVEIKQARVTAAQLDASESNQTDAEVITSEEFHDNVKYVLMEWDFNSVSKQSSALTAASTQTTGWSYLYDLPSDFLRLNEILISGRRCDPRMIPHEIQGSSLMCNITSPVLRYNYYPALTGMADDATVTSTWNAYIQGWNPMLRQAVKTYIKHVWVESLKHDSKRSTELLALYEDVYLVKAKMADALGESPMFQDPGGLIYARQDMAEVGGDYGLSYP